MEFGLSEAVHFSVTLTKNIFICLLQQKSQTNQTMRMTDWAVCRHFQFQHCLLVQSCADGVCIKRVILLQDLIFQRLWGQCKSRFWLCQVLFSDSGPTSSPENCTLSTPESYWVLMQGISVMAACHQTAQLYQTRWEIKKKKKKTSSMLC